MVLRVYDLLRSSSVQRGGVDRKPLACEDMVYHSGVSDDDGVVFVVISCVGDSIGDSLCC